MTSMDYRNMMSNIKASESFKKETIEKMQEEAAGRMYEYVITPTQKKTKRWLMLPAGALALACVVWASVTLFPWAPHISPAGNSGFDYPMYNGLPMISLHGDTSPDSNDASPFVPIFSGSAQDITTAHPWKEGDILTTLPVFRNPAKYEWDEHGAVYTDGPSTEEMLRRGKDAALALGFTIQTETVYPPEFTKPSKMTGPTNYTVSLECKEGGIEVFPDGSITIQPATPIELPDKYAIKPSPVTREWAEARINYLIDRFSTLLDMENPVAYPWDFYQDGFHDYFYMVAEGKGDLSDQMLGFTYQNCIFYMDNTGNGEEGILTIYLYQADLSQKLGDYPVISTDQARAMLLSGKYYSDCPDAPVKDRIAGVELSYKKGEDHDMFVPFYRFLVDVESEHTPEGLKAYASYFVPAIPEEYYSSKPDWSRK